MRHHSAWLVVFVAACGNQVVENNNGDGGVDLAHSSSDGGGGPPDFSIVGGDGGNPGPGPSIGGCPIFAVPQTPTPDNNSWWNVDISDVNAFPVDPNNDAYMASMNAGATHLHPDFGSDPSYGIPWITVPGNQPKVPMTFTYSDESDPGPYPFPNDAPVEGGSDRHVLVIDTGACKLYETFNSQFVGPGWNCDSGAIFDLKTGALRPEGWTSADAAGLPILPGLARRDEAMSGEIRHALRFTVQHTQQAWVHPAVHQAGSSMNASLPPMGLRVRLKASYDTSGFTGLSKPIAAAMKKYGMILADNGSNWYVSGETNTSWDDNDLNQIKSIPASQFEVIQLPTLRK